MTTIAQLLAVARRHHQAGNHAQAEQGHRQVLQAEPRPADALYLLGVIALQGGDHARAISHIREALSRNPSDAEAHGNLGLAYHESGNLDAAVACYREALRLQPCYAEAHDGLGNALKQRGKLDEAVASYRQAVSLKPECAGFHNNLGNALMEQGKPDEAVPCYFPLIDLGNTLDEASGPFMDTAAVMKCLDLVVTSDTSIAHLAGALGVPVWVAIPLAPDWRWLLDREDSPWYPTMRLFRQARLGDWESVFVRMAEQLRIENRGSRIEDRTGRSIDRRSARPIRVEIAPGELIDKITILQIKSERMTDPAKLRNVRTELEVLTAERDRAIGPSEELAGLTAELKAVNERLWDIEDAIRRCEREEDFGSRFVELARSVYHQNDHRAALKRKINELLGSRIIEEKSYASYQPPG